MKKINLIFIFFIIITIILIACKIYNQEIIENIEIESGISIENLEYEVEREILFGEKSKYSQFNENNQRINTSEEIKKMKNIDQDLEIQNFDISYQDGYSRINVKVKNVSSEIKGGYNVNLIFYNDENEETFRTRAILNLVNPNSETIIATTILADIADVYRCEIEKVEDNSNE